MATQKSVYSFHHVFLPLTLQHSEWPKLYGVLAILSAIGFNQTSREVKKGRSAEENFGTIFSYFSIKTYAVAPA